MDNDEEMRYFELLDNEYSPRNHSFVAPSIGSNDLQRAIQYAQQLVEPHTNTSSTVGVEVDSHDQVPSVGAVRQYYVHVSGDCVSIIRNNVTKYYYCWSYCILSTNYEYKRSGYLLKHSDNSDILSQYGAVLHSIDVALSFCIENLDHNSYLVFITSNKQVLEDLTVKTSENSFLEKLKSKTLIFYKFSVENFFLSLDDASLQGLSNSISTVQQICEDRNLNKIPEANSPLVPQIRNNYKSVPYISGCGNKLNRKRIGDYLNHIDKKRKISKDNQNTVRLPFNLVIVTPSNFKTFKKGWESQSQYSWGLKYTSILFNEMRKKEVFEDLYNFLPEKNVIESISISWDTEVVYSLSLRSSDHDSFVDKAWNLVSNMLTKVGVRKIQFDMKSQLKLLLVKNIRVDHCLMDPKIALWVFESEKNRDKDISEVYEIVVNKQPISILDDINRTHILVYMSLEISNVLLRRFKNKEKLKTVLYKIEMPLIPVLALMEYYGVGFNYESYSEQENEIRKRLKQLENHAHQLAGKEFSLTALSEVSDIIFNHMDIEFPRGVESGKNHRSVRKSVLKLIEHPISEVILQHRKLTHTINTYISSLPQFCFYSNALNMKRIFSTTLQTAVPTGRLAMTDPNLQSIVKKFRVNFNGIINGSDITVNIRDSFMASNGFILLSADYSQLELRIMAWFAKDVNLNRDINSEYDVFKCIASTWMEKLVHDISQEERNRAKKVVYGIIYGMGPNQLSKDLKVSVQTAREYLASFRNTYPGIKKFQHDTIKSCTNSGYIETLLGRRRYIPYILSNKRREKSRADRQAINSVCQGTAADICKIAMLEMDRYIQESNSSARLLVQIHDEIIFEVKVEELEK
eukprot:TRINITY_DN6267_c0_g1_i2.p1 TRINITY_DN6267_c0_g1~~TRINITY_DN6267_c0_g1_i2.p1  ORF type:complete len:859 (+),score=149.89 TRINITY_DN6267_c0_g1_i2:27-2603(+)